MFPRGLVCSITASDGDKNVEDINVLPLKMRPAMSVRKKSGFL